MKKAWIIRRNEEAVSPVIATILMVAITVVLAAVLYVMVSGLIGGTTTAEPNIQFSSPRALGSNRWELKIGGVSEAKDLSNFKAIVTENGTALTPMDPVQDGGSAPIQFEDLDGGGTLSIGDYFTITCNSNSDYTISIVWKASGNERGSANWAT